MKIKNKMIDNFSYDKMLKTDLTETVTNEQLPYTVTIDVANELIPFKVLKQNGVDYDLLSSGNGFTSKFNDSNQLEITFNTEGTYKIIYGSTN